MAETSPRRPAPVHAHEATPPLFAVELDDLSELQTERPRPFEIKHKTKTWWQDHIAQEVPFDACRDYYALERTYLAWVRTSLKFAHFGIVVAQLFRLPDYLLPSSPLVSEFFRLGKPLGIVSISLAIVTISLGGFRCWQQQRWMVEGRVRSCGWEIWAVVLFTLGYIIAISVFVTGDAASGKPV